MKSHTSSRDAISGECFLGTGQCSEGAGELSVWRPPSPVDCQGSSSSAWILRLRGEDDGSAVCTGHR